MDYIFYDRFTGDTVSQPEAGQTIVGRWLIVPPTGTSVFLNSVPVSSGDFLVPEVSGSWRLLEQDGTVLRGSVVRDQRPDEIEAESLRTIGAHLDSLVEGDACWLDWLYVVPLVPGMSEKVKLLRFDKMIREFLGHLKTVCMKPRAHLDVEVELVFVAKARRLPVKAASYLASHTEDWERPLLRGVLPKRILSEVRHDQVDIYENHIAARLVDYISVHLSHRIRVIRKLLNMFQDKEDYSSAVGGTYLRQERILKLWGDSIDTNEGRRKAEDTLWKLKRLKYRVMGLMDSPLYREVPRRSRVTPTLRTTNILANDQHYRGVAELWREWVGSGHADTKSPMDIHREAQSLCRGLDRFSLLLLMRALEQLGYLPCEQDEDKSIRAPGRWTLEGHGTRIDCVWEEDESIRVETFGRALVFLSVTMDLSRASNDAQVQTVIDRVESMANDDGNGKRFIVLYIGSLDEPHKAISEETCRRIHSVGNDPRTGLLSSIGFLPVSPWDIGSVERIARALRWFLDSARFDAYPLIIEVERAARHVWDSEAMNGWLESCEDGSRLTVRRPPNDFEWNRLGVERLVEETKESHSQAVAEHQGLADELRIAVRKGRTGTLNQQKKAAQARCVESEMRLAAVQRLHEDLQEVRNRSGALLVCPGCGTGADPRQDFKPRDKGCFRCDCRGCRTRWGVRLCSNGHRYAVMLPGDFVDTEDSGAGWEDRTYGSDLLALPARSPNGKFGFVCPLCGEIT